jgi:hypothetical protein
VPDDDDLEEPTPPRSPQVKRDREGSDGSAELERLTRGQPSHMAGPRSPHESTEEFLQMTMSEDEVSIARGRELEQLEKFGVYECVNPEEYKGHKVIGCTWVDRRLTADTVKSRLCATEFAHGKKDVEFYSATPSTANLRFIDWA